MNAFAPRLRIFAGPNGSGKSTIKDQLPSRGLGAYVNANETDWEALPSADQLAVKIDAQSLSDAERAHRREHNLGALRVAANR